MLQPYRFAEIVMLQAEMGYCVAMREIFVD